MLERTVGIERLREIAGALGVGGNGAGEIDGIVLARFFEIDEEECFLFLDRAAEREAVLIADVIGLGDAAGVVEEVVGVESRALAVPPAAAVKIVGAFLEDDVDDGAAVVAVFGGEAVVLDFEFLNDFDGGLVVDVGGAAFALFGGAGERAVEPDFRGGIALAVGDEVGAGGVGVLRAGAGGFGDAAGEKDEAEEAAIDERDVANVLVGDVGAERGVAGVEERGLVGDVDGFGGAAGIESEVDVGFLADGEGETFALLGVEAGGGDADGVGGWANANEDEDAALVGVERGGDAGAFVGERDFCAGNDTAAGVGNDAGELSGVAGLGGDRAGWG